MIYASFDVDNVLARAQQLKLGSDNNERQNHHQQTQQLGRSASTATHIIHDYKTVRGRSEYIPSANSYIDKFTSRVGALESSVISRKSAQVRLIQKRIH